MGSSASSGIKPISKTKGKKTSKDVENEHKNAEDIKPVSEEIPHLPKDAQTKMMEYASRVEMLEKQLSAVESEKLDMQDRVQVLEENMAATAPMFTIPEEDEACLETVKVKDTHIIRLEEENKSLLNDMSKLRGRSKKRLRLLNKQMEETRQACNLKVMELTEEILQLMDDNKKLKEKLTRSALMREKSNLSSKETINVADDLLDDSRTKVILELSSQVSEQITQIGKLEQDLLDRDRTIQDMKRQLCESSTAECLDTTKSLNSSVAVEHNEDISELKAIAKEFKAIKAKGQKTRTDPSLDAMAKYSEYKSTTSKSKTNEDITKPERVPSATSLSSILSISDWESDIVSPKVHSAPVGTRRNNDNFPIENDLMVTKSKKKIMLMDRLTRHQQKMNSGDAGLPPQSLHRKEAFGSSIAEQNETAFAADSDIYPLIQNDTKLIHVAPVSSS